jgi:hypothetical protein
MHGVSGDVLSGLGIFFSIFRSIFVLFGGVFVSFEVILILPLFDLYYSDNNTVTDFGKFSVILA